MVDAPDSRREIPGASPRPWFQPTFAVIPYASPSPRLITPPCTQRILLLTFHSSARPTPSSCASTPTRTILLHAGATFWRNSALRQETAVRRRARNPRMHPLDDHGSRGTPRLLDSHLQIRGMDNDRWNRFVEYAVTLPCPVISLWTHLFIVQLHAVRLVSI